VEAHVVACVLGLCLLIARFLAHTIMSIERLTYLFGMYLFVR